MKSLNSSARNKLIAVIAAAIAAVTTTVVTVNNNTSSDRNTFTHVDSMPKSNIVVKLYAGHGGIIDNVYQTQGKQSPLWPDGTKIYEGYSCRLLCYEIAHGLLEAGIEVEFVNAFNDDMSLADRVTSFNAMYKKDSRCVFLEIHHNAQPTTNAPYTDKYGLKGYLDVKSGGATGIESFTTEGWTASDTINEYYIIPSLEKSLPDVKFRYGNKQKGKEAQFYVLRNTYGKSNLIEFMFMTTKSPDCDILTNKQIRSSFAQAVVTAYVDYNNSLN